MNDLRFFISPLPSMGRGRGGVTSGVERGGSATSTQPSPIEGEGFEVRP